jgi:hypothetical protein
LLAVAEVVGLGVFFTFRDSWSAIMLGIVLATLLLIFVAVAVWTWRESRRRE